MSAHPSPALVWLNPPRHDDPHDDIIIELHPPLAAAVADALAEAAEWAERNGDREAARVLRHVADDIEAARVTWPRPTRPDCHGRRPGTRPVEWGASETGRRFMGSSGIVRMSRRPL